MLKIDGWKDAKIQDVLSNRTEKFDPKTTDEELNYIGLEHINQDSGTINGYGLSSDTTSMKTKFYEQDILYGKLRPYLRKYWHADFAGVCSTEILALKPKANNDSKFCYYLIQDDEVQNQVAAKTFGTKMPRTSWNELKQYEVSVPPLPEQKKIAKILSTVDGHIEEVDGMIEDLKELKKGLMQKLLTEGIGHTEFKDSEVGRIPVEWVVKTLIDISTSKPTYGINAAAKDYVVDEPRYLRISDIDDYGRLLKNDVRGVDADDYSGYLLANNDLVFARTGNTTGKSFLYRTEYGELVFAGFLIRFNIDSNQADADFITHICNSKRYWDWVSVMSQRSGQPGINSKEYSSFVLPIPPLEEQKKIAFIINGIDKRICLYEEEIENLSELKKGLMQQLLTGKKRVKIDG